MATLGAVDRARLDATRGAGAWVDARRVGTSFAIGSSIPLGLGEYLEEAVVSLFGIHLLRGIHEPLHASGSAGCPGLMVAASGFPQPPQNLILGALSERQVAHRSFSDARAGCGRGPEWPVRSQRAFFDGCGPSPVRAKRGEDDLNTEAATGISTPMKIETSQLIVRGGASKLPEGPRRAEGTRANSPGSPF